MAKKISPERKATYHVGQILSGCGLLMFLCMFVVLPIVGFTTNPFGNEGIIGFCFVIAFLGLVLASIGGVVMNIGKKGLAGSGILLDPEREREEMEPFARMKGGMVKDGLEEAGLVDENGLKIGRGNLENSTVSVIKVRCRVCNALNDEDAKFCKQCGSEM